MRSQSLFFSTEDFIVILEMEDVPLGDSGNSLLVTLSESFQLFFHIQGNLLDHK